MGIQEEFAFRSKAEAEEAAKKALENELLNPGHINNAYDVSQKADGNWEYVLKIVDKSEEETPAEPETPGETTPSTPGETTPSTPGETTPSTPGKTTPSTPGETTPSTPEEGQKPEEGKPGKEENLKKKTNQLKKKKKKMV